jgi:hypothetical protein
MPIRAKIDVITFRNNVNSTNPKTILLSLSKWAIAIVLNNNKAKTTGISTLKSAIGDISR